MVITCKVSFITSTNSGSLLIVNATHVDDCVSLPWIRNNSDVERLHSISINPLVPVGRWRDAAEKFVYCRRSRYVIQWVADLEWQRFGITSQECTFARSSYRNQVSTLEFIFHDHDSKESTNSAWLNSRNPHDEASCARAKLSNKTS